MVCALRLAQEKLMKAKYLIVKHAISTSSIGYLASIGNLGDIIKTIGINMLQRNRLNANLHVRAYNSIIYRLHTINFAQNMHKIRWSILSFSG